MPEKEVIKSQEVIPMPESTRVIETGVLKAVESFEQTPEQKQESLSEGSSTSEKVSVSVQQVVVSQAQQQYELRRKDIESIMSKGLEDLYATFSPVEQQQFRIVGEETAVKVNMLLNEASLKVNKIINLIKDWLKLIPGANKFFLEQEAKIKTDAIIQLTKGGEQ